MATKKTPAPSIAPANPPSKNFNVTARVSVDVSIAFYASTWEEAVVQAGMFKIEDFVTVDGILQDEEPIELISLWTNLD